jgi:hypothetical protein
LRFLNNSIIKIRDDKNIGKKEAGKIIKDIFTEVANKLEIEIKLRK